LFQSITFYTYFCYQLILNISILPIRDKVSLMRTNICEYIIRIRNVLSAYRVL